MTCEALAENPPKLPFSCQDIIFISFCLLLVDILDMMGKDISGKVLSHQEVSLINMHDTMYIKVYIILEWN